MLPIVDWQVIRSQIGASALPYQRGALAQKIGTATLTLKFVALARALAPDKFRRRRAYSPGACYKLVVQWCREHFPVCFEAEAGFDQAEDGDDPWFLMHVPLELYGIEMYDDPPESPSIEMCWCAHPRVGGEWNMNISDMHTLARYESVLPANLVGGARKYIKPPKGRVFIPPWNGLRDLYDWVHASTGFSFLDYADGQTDVYTYPRWNLDELRGLAHQWERAKPVYDRARALMRFVDANPDTHLRTLAGALLRDRATLMQITRPARVKTLAEMWK